MNQCAYKASNQSCKFWKKYLSWAKLWKKFWNSASQILLDKFTQWFLGIKKYSLDIYWFMKSSKKKARYKIGAKFYSPKFQSSILTARTPKEKRCGRKNERPEVSVAPEQTARISQIEESQMKRTCKSTCSTTFDRFARITPAQLYHTFCQKKIENSSFPLPKINYRKNLERDLMENIFSLKSWRSAK